MEKAIGDGALAGRLTREDALLLIADHRRAAQLEQLARDLADADELLAALYEVSALDDSVVGFVRETATTIRMRLEEALGANRI